MSRRFRKLRTFSPKKRRDIFLFLYKTQKICTNFCFLPVKKNSRSLEKNFIARYIFSSTCVSKEKKQQATYGNDEKHLAYYLPVSALCLWGIPAGTRRKRDNRRDRKRSFVHTATEYRQSGQRQAQLSAVALPVR